MSTTAHPLEIDHFVCSLPAYALLDGLKWIQRLSLLFVTIVFIFSKQSLYIFEGIVYSQLRPRIIYHSNLSEQFLKLRSLSEVIFSDSTWWTLRLGLVCIVTLTVFFGSRLNMSLFQHIEDLVRQCRFENKTHEELNPDEQEDVFWCSFSVNWFVTAVLTMTLWPLAYAAIINVNTIVII